MCDPFTFAAETPRVEAGTFHIEICIADKGTHLLTCTHGHKAAVRSDKRNAACARHACGDVHCTLLGNPTFNITFRILVAKCNCTHCLERIGINAVNVLPFIRQVHHCRRECFTCPLKLSHLTRLPALSLQSPTLHLSERPCATHCCLPYNLDHSP